MVHGVPMSMVGGMAIDGATAMVGAMAKVKAMANVGAMYEVGAMEMLRGMVICLDVLWQKTSRIRPKMATQSDGPMVSRRYGPYIVRHQIIRI